MQAARDAARRSQCQNNVKQIALAAQHFHTSFNRFPPQFGWLATNIVTGANSGDVGTVFFHLLPYIEERNVFQKALIPANQSQTYPCSFTQIAGTHDSRDMVGSEELALTFARTTVLSPTRCRIGAGGLQLRHEFSDLSQQKGTPTNGGSSCDAGAVALWQGRCNIAFIRDGTSNTLMIGEKFGDCQSTGPYPGNPSNWYSPQNGGGNMWARWDGLDSWQPAFAAFITGPASMFQDNPQPFTYGGPCNPLLAQVRTPGSSSAGMADGSVRFLAATLDANVWWAICTPAGGENPTLGD